MDPTGQGCSRRLVLEEAAEEGLWRLSVPMAGLTQVHSLCSPELEVPPLGYDLWPVMRGGMVQNMSCCILRPGGSHPGGEETVLVDEGGS